MNDLIQASINRRPPLDVAADPASLRGLTDRRLAEIVALFPIHAPALGAAMAEAVLAPGKRFRATLMLMTAAGTGGISPAAIDAAAALEVIHAASLVIDDLPAMDNATLRRGRPTTHVAHGESRAILAGIALVAEAFRLLARLPETDGRTQAHAVAILAECIGHAGLCAGQDMDLHAPKSLQSVRQEQDLKTGALFAAGFRIIAALQGLDASRTVALSGLSERLGRVFQSYDDLRDVAGTIEALGKDKGLDRTGAGPSKGLMSVSRFGDALPQYRVLRDDLDAALVAMWFDTTGLRDYIRAVLPEDPEIPPGG